MANINQSYYDRVRYILQNKNLGSLVVSEPEGWKTDDKELSRHKDYHGIFPKFSNSLKFYGSSRDYLKQVYDIYGINEDVRLLKEEKHPKTDIWTRVYDGYLDLSTYEDEDKKVSLKFNSGGLEAILKTRIDDEVEITRETTIDGKSLNPISEIDVELDGRRIYLISDFEKDTTVNQITLDVTSDAGNTRRVTSGFPLNLVNKSHEESQGVIYLSEGNELVGTTGMMFFANSIDTQTILIKAKNISFKPVITSDYPGNGPSNDIDWGIISLCLTVFENGIDYNVKSREYLFSSQNLPGNTFDQLIQTDRVLRSFTFDRTLNLLPNESVALEFFIEADLATGFNQHFRVDFTEMGGTLVVEEDSFFEKTNTKAVLPFELADRLLEVYTDEKCLKSDALGRTDIGYPKDGIASLVAQTNGFNIRGFSKDDELYKPLTTSLKDFLENFDSTHNLGMGIERIGFKEYVRIEELSYFYNRNTTIRLPNRVNKVKRSIATDYYYSSIDIGNEKGATYEEAFGLVEYNGLSKFSTIITRVKNIYSKITKYRSDSFGIEFARRKPKVNFATTDTKYDTDIFNLDLKRFFGFFKLRKWQDDFEEEPNGTFSPETAFNLRLSPLNCLLRHGWVIASGFTKYLSDYISYSSSTANSSLTTKLIDGNQYSENGRIVNSELKRPKYVPEYLEFTHPLDFEITQLLNGTKNILGKEVLNIYGCVEFINEEGDIEKGFIINLKPNKGEWKLLKAY